MDERSFRIPRRFPKGRVVYEDGRCRPKALSERLVHKVWKTRSEAYVELGEYFKKTTDFSSTEVMEYVALFPKFTKDSNAVSKRDVGYDSCRKSSVPEDIAQGMLTKLIESSLNNVRSAEVATELLVLMPVPLPPATTWRSSKDSRAESENFLLHASLVLRRPSRSSASMP